MLLIELEAVPSAKRARSTKHLRVAELFEKLGDLPEDALQSRRRPRRRPCARRPGAAREASKTSPERTEAPRSLCRPPLVGGGIGRRAVAADHAPHAGGRGPGRSDRRRPGRDPTLLASILTGEGVPEEAILAAARKLEPLLEATGRPGEERLDVVERIAQVESDDGARRATPSGRAARLATQLGQHPRGIALWKKRVKADAGDAEALDGLVDLLDRVGDSEHLAQVLDLRARASTSAESRRADRVRVAKLLGDVIRRPEDAIESWRGIERDYGEADDAALALSALLRQTARWPELAAMLERRVENTEESAARAGAPSPARRRSTAITSVPTSSPWPPTLGLSKSTHATRGAPRGPPRCSRTKARIARRPSAGASEHSALATSWRALHFEADVALAISSAAPTNDDTKLSGTARSRRDLGAARGRHRPRLRGDAPRIRHRPGGSRSPGRARAPRRCGRRVARPRRRLPRRNRGSGARRRTPRLDALEQDRCGARDPARRPTRRTGRVSSRARGRRRRRGRMRSRTRRREARRMGRRRACRRRSREGSGSGAPRSARSPRARRGGGGSVERGDSCARRRRRRERPPRTGRARSARARRRAAPGPPRRPGRSRNRVPARARARRFESRAPLVAGRAPAADRRPTPGQHAPPAVARHRRRSCALARSVRRRQRVGGRPGRSRARFPRTSSSI